MLSEETPDIIVSQTTQSRSVQINLEAVRIVIQAPTTVFRCFVEDLLSYSS